MYGAIIGDIIGSAYEFKGRTKEYNFELVTERSRFTDDTVMTIGTLDAILSDKNYAKAYRKWGKKYPKAGYGFMFKKWLFDDSLDTMGSFGNGSAMRVSPTGWLYDTLEDTMKEARASSIVSHDHEQGIKGAKVIAGLIFMARKGSTKEEMLEYAKKYYDLNFSLDEIRPTYKFNATCPGSVPQAIMCFIESKDFEDCIRKAVSLGGDADTLAAMAGSIAEAYSINNREYLIPANLIKLVKERCPSVFVDLIEKMPGEYQQLLEIYRY